MKTPVAYFRTCRRFAATLLGIGAAASSLLFAAPAGEGFTPPTTSTPPASSPSNTGSSSSSSNDFPSYPSSPMAAQGNFNDPLYQSRNNDYFREPPSRPWQFPIYFPPSPPSLGAPIPLPNPMLLPSERAPDGLADYVNEFFYAPLGTRLAQNRLSPRQLEKINAYRAAKTALQNEIRTKLAALRKADETTRTEELAQLARAQAPRLAALEKTAEELRGELVRGEFFQSSADWNLTRDWKLESSRFYTAKDALTAQFQVMRAAPFYQKGLSAEQRGLLREIAMELHDVRPTQDSDETVGLNPPLFFSPATARLRLPPDLPGSLGEKIAAYEREKSALKQELRETVYAQDRTYFSNSRVRALEALAEKQWPRLAALEELAEDIRRDLTRLPEPPGPPAPPPLPAALATRISNYIEARSAMQQDILAKIGQLKKDFAIQRVIPSKNPGGGSDLRLVIDPSSQTDAKMKALQASLASINKEMSNRQHAMRVEEDAIRRQFVEAVPDAGSSGRSLESLLGEYAEDLLQREDWSRYDDYQAAMLTPGLSPEQRRVLFDAGVEKLILPLPGWDLTSVRVLP